VGAAAVNVLSLSEFGSSTPVPQGYLAPILAFELDVVGFDNSQSTDLQGQGNITYAASAPMTPLGTVPPPGSQGSGSIYTLETANSFYGELPGVPTAMFTQPFSSNSLLPRIRRVGKYGM
jgi:hypothetical protein